MTSEGRAETPPQSALAERVTLERLCFLASVARARGFPPGRDGPRSSRSSQQALLAEGVTVRFIVTTLPPEIVQHPLYAVASRADLRDGWGGAIRYRCPGRRYTEGWEVHSCGPDGIDNGGEGDDLVLGWPPIRTTTGREPVQLGRSGQALSFVRRSLILTGEHNSHRRNVLFEVAPGASPAELAQNLRCLLEGDYSPASDYWAMVLSVLTKRSNFALYTSDNSTQKQAKIRELLEDLNRNP